VTHRIKERLFLRNLWVGLGFAMLLAPAANLVAQVATIGRLPLLTLPISQGAACVRDTSNAALRAQSVATMISVKEPDRSRFLSLAVSNDGHPQMLFVSMGTRSDRRTESESVIASFSAEGSILQGNRYARTGGVPARSSEDRSSGLLAADSADVLKLVASIHKHCRAMMPNTR